MKCRLSKLKFWITPDGNFIQVQQHRDPVILAGTTYQNRVNMHGWARMAVTDDTLYIDVNFERITRATTAQKRAIKNYAIEHQLPIADNGGCIVFDPIKSYDKLE